MIQHIAGERAWSQIVARAWADEGFKNRLLSNPRAVLTEHGITLVSDAKIRVVEGNAVALQENDPGLLWLPPSPADELIEEELGGTEVAYCYCRCGRCGCGCAACRCRCYKPPQDPDVGRPDHLSRAS
jgi:hypothetical protein